MPHPRQELVAAKAAAVGLAELAVQLAQPALVHRYHQREAAALEAAAELVAESAVFEVWSVAVHVHHLTQVDLVKALVQHLMPVGRVPVHPTHPTPVVQALNRNPQAGAKAAIPQQ